MWRKRLERERRARREGPKPAEAKPAVEEKLAEEKPRPAAAIKGMIDVVGVSDMDGRITQINEAVEAWGYKKEELIGKPIVAVIAKRSLSYILERKEFL